MLIEQLQRQIYRQYVALVNNVLEKKTTPLYLFLSRAGTGKSRNAKEFHKLALKCFDGTYPFNWLDEGDHVPQIAKRLRDSFVLHVSLENGSNLRTYKDAWTGYHLLSFL